MEDGRAAAGRYDVDVIHFGSPEMEALARENILEPVDSPVHADLQPGSVPVHNPGYILDDKILPIGASMFARIIETRLPVGSHA